MNNLFQLNNMISESLNSHNPEAIIEISTIEQLLEMSGVGGIQAYGAPFGDTKKIAKFNKNEEKKQRLKGKQLTKEEDEMIKREEIVTEIRLRQYIRQKIKKLTHEQQKKQMQQEMHLRGIIRRLLKEGDISDIHPHRSTGINVLEDLLKKMIPTLRTDFKRLTTDKTQRDSFRAHLVKAIKDSLLPMMVNDKYQPEDEGAPSPAGSGALLSEPTGEPEVPEEPIEEPDTGDEEAELANLEEEFQILDELEVELGDEEKKIPVEDDDTPSEEEAFGTGLEGLDETGRNMAFTCFKKVSQYILDAYDSLANPKDKEIFIDYLVTNVKLYFDKFEDEIAKTVDEPTTSQYDDAKV